jgi:DNA-binding NarL/FixJ family response regulator
MEKARILIADDHDLVRKGIRSVLEEYQDFDIVGEAIDGPSLFSAIDQLTPDCVLIDVTMPNFDPISAVKKIHQEYPRLKILIVSAHDDDVYVKGLLAAGADGYHLKDSPLSDLSLALGRIMMGEQWLSSSLVKKLIHNNVETKGTSGTIGKLSAGQFELLALLQKGLDNKTIANHLNKSIKTVENNLTRLYHNINVQSRLEAVNYVNQHPEIFSKSLNETIQINSTMLSRPTTKPLNVLLVDDNNHYRHEFKNSLNIAYPSANVSEAQSISEALAQVKLNLIRLVFVDMILDKENGIECIHQMKLVSPDTRFILMSAYPDREFHRMGIEAGALAFVDKKDLDIATLRQIVIDSIN